MDTKRFFLYFIVITALALAGCGGGGGTQTTMPPDPPPTPDPCPAGQVGTPPNCTDPAPTVADLFETARTAEDNATGAVMTAEQAVEDAEKYSDMITVDKVRGDSMMAQTNAQTVLDAKTAADGAVTTAETALMNAQGAEDDAAQYNNDVLDSAIAAAIEVAQDAVKDAKAQAGDIGLKRAVEKVTGTDEDEPMTAADHAKMVAMAVGEALGAAGNTDGSGTRVTFQTAIDPTVTDVAAANYRPEGEAKYEQNDSPGMTWAEIVGSDNIMSMRISTGVTAPATTRTVDAASIAGMPASTVSATAGNVPAMSTDTATVSGRNGTEFADANYMGIPGVSFCAGTDCNVDASGNLTGSWYFTPAGPKVWYRGTPNADGDTVYTGENQYARYGYWVSGTNDAATVNVYAIVGVAADDTATGVTATGTTAGTHYDITTDNSQVSGATILVDAEATYSGDAIGLSLYKEFNADGSIADGYPQTGQFTADVELTAKFGTAPSLGGRITNFQGDAVDEAWSVTLRDTAFTGGNIAETANAPAVGSATQGGIWTATAYGNAGTTDVAGTPTLSVRPTGIFGHFNTHFTNGHAAGAYATRKD